MSWNYLSIVLWIGPIIMRVVIGDYWLLFNCLSILPYHVIWNRHCRESQNYLPISCSCMYSSPRLSLTFTVYCTLSLTFVTFFCHFIHLFDVFFQIMSWNVHCNFPCTMNKESIGYVRQTSYRTTFYFQEKNPQFMQT
jgi:hypothetical protein